MSGVRTRALIMVVSRPESVEIAVEKIRPEAIGLISSQNIHAKIAMKADELEDRARFLHGMVDSPMEIRHAFERFEYLLSELEKLGYGHEDLLLDATGGTTPMRLGAALAAMTRGIDMVHQQVAQHYVDGRWERDKSKEIVVVPMDNPLESTGLLREGQAVELFDRRDYPAAALVFADVVNKVSGVERGHYYEGLLLLSEGYASWDVADYGTALEKLKLAREELSVGFAETVLAERAAKITAHTTTHLPFLGKVRGQISIENVVDMLENAHRRIADQGRYDDGVARLYRCVEMWHQFRLLESYSLATKAIQWAKVPENAKAEFLTATGFAELPEDLDLVRARILDHILSGENPEESKVLRDLLQKRNSSILAHGLKPIDEASAKRFLEYVGSMVGERETRSSAEHIRLKEL